MSYLRDKYGRPIRPNGYSIDHPYEMTLRLKCGGKLNAPNFKYNSPKRISIDHTTFWQSVITILHKNDWSNGVKFGQLSLAVLTVQVPDDLRHPFWARETTSYRWDLKGLGTTFVVEKYGDDRDEAFHFATQHAINVIQTIRRRNDPSPCAHPIPPDPQNFAAFKLGRKLHDMWMSAVDDAFRVSGHKFWAEACNKLDSFIQEFPRFRFLLEYYKVLFPRLCLLSLSPLPPQVSLRSVYTHHESSAHFSITQITFTSILTYRHSSCFGCTRPVMP